ncbi:hypothetical protein ACHAXR_005369 [Thalassiosira sp. AJA248-18]
MARDNKPRKNSQTGEWTYPSSEVVLEEVGVWSQSDIISRCGGRPSQHTLWIDLFSVFAGMERECEAPAPAYGGGSNIRTWTWTWQGVLMQCPHTTQVLKKGIYIE